jgi:thymidylate synthase (FAD)
MTEIRLITEPTVIVLADMQLDTNGANQLLDWVKDYRPECVPDDLPTDARSRAMSLFPHRGMGRGEVFHEPLTGNELLVELGGRACYQSWGLKAGRKDNREYIARMLFPEEPGMLPHASVAYHAKMTFFLAGISRRVSHELIRHYVGADRSEEGSPSQESTRYTFHPGHFAVPPYVINGGPSTIQTFRVAMESAYQRYLSFIDQEEGVWAKANGKNPTAIDRKRIYEAAAGLLPMQACTSMVWTTNPLALGKLFGERCSEFADAEFQRFAVKWREIAEARWPNLFRARK